MPLSLEDGTALVRFAREAMRAYLIEGQPADIPKGLPSALMHEKSGVSVTVLGYPDSVVHAHVDVHEADLPLAESISKASLAAIVAISQAPGHLGEGLDDLIIRATVISKPKKMSWGDPKELVRKVSVGKDGLMIKVEGQEKYILPQTAVEKGWNEEAFLSNLCIHAGLPGYAWQEGKVEISSFTAQIFEEETPGGTVKEVRLPTY